MIAALLFIIPLAGILLSCIAAMRSERMRDCIYRSELVLVFAFALAAFICCLRGNAQTLSLNSVCGMGLRLCLDGFRSVLAAVFCSLQKQKPLLLLLASYFRRNSSNFPFI